MRIVKTRIKKTTAAFTSPPSLINLTVSVDAKHHVYLLTPVPIQAGKARKENAKYVETARRRPSVRCGEVLLNVLRCQLTY